MDNIQTLIDEAECLRLVANFANAVDRRDYAAVLSVFTEDGVLDRLGERFCGKQEIAACLDARSTQLATRHLCTNMKITFTSDNEAEGFCYVLFYSAETTPAQDPPFVPLAPGVAEYFDRFVRTRQGWRIRERKVRMAMKG
jgi:hypothetical protein